MESVRITSPTSTIIWDLVKGSGLHYFHYRIGRTPAIQRFESCGACDALHTVIVVIIFFKISLELTIYIYIVSEILKLFSFKCLPLTLQKSS